MAISLKFELSLYFVKLFENLFLESILRKSIVFGSKLVQTRRFQFEETETDSTNSTNLANSEQ